MSIKTYKVIYSPETNDDLKSIYRYIAVDLRGKGNAKNQTERIRNKIHGLTTFPEKYKAVDWKPWSEINMRQVVIDNYVAYYLINHDKLTVTIVRIFYGGRDIQNQINIGNTA